jgi:hypothetical protein
MGVATTVLEVRYLKFLTFEIPRIRVESKAPRTEGQDAFAEARMDDSSSAPRASWAITCLIVQTLPAARGRRGASHSDQLSGRGIRDISMPVSSLF